ncbi:hypothetical protein J8J40_23500, partial [Mycobacterium tuberculosis]|nr:hypothetical protein [Mycobacterium tuberculosis]
MLRAVARRGHEHWCHWHFGGGCSLRLSIGGAVFDYASGVLRRVAPDAPDGRGRHVNGASFDTVYPKQGAKDFLAARGFSVPEGRAFAPDAVEAALAYAATLGGPVCVKPNHGKKGINVA